MILSEKTLDSRPTTCGNDSTFSRFLLLTRFSRLLLLTAYCLLFSVFFCGVSFAGTQKSDCVECHRKVTPGIVQQHLQGKMAKAGVDCSACHGSEHKKMADAKLAALPTLATCAGCHKKQADQLKSGKHAECSDCHSRHLFSKLEAQNPNICRACHASQWEIWSTSRHGIIWQIEGKWSKRVPTCRTCHMPNGNHSEMENPAVMVRICTKCHGAGYAKKTLNVECFIPISTGQQ